MTIPHLCLLIVAMLPFPWTMLAKVSKRYDNRTPRAYLAGLEGWRARAHAAHQNAWEALAMFTAAIVVAGQAGRVEPVDQLAGDCVCGRARAARRVLCGESGVVALAGVVCRLACRGVDVFRVGALNRAARRERRSMRVTHQSSRKINLTHVASRNRMAAIPFIPLAVDAHVSQINHFRASAPRAQSASPCSPPSRC